MTKFGIEWILKWFKFYVVHNHGSYSYRWKLKVIINALSETLNVITTTAIVIRLISLFDNAVSIHNSVIVCTFLRI